MARINLLPWREELRQQRKKEFFTLVGSSMAVMVGVVILVHIHYQGLIDFQQKRNQTIETEISIFEQNIKTIETIKTELDQLKKKMATIESLQSHRPEVVHLFDQLASTIPDGLYLTKITQQGRTLTIDGVAQSNARVSAFMRSLHQSEWFGEPNLEVIRANTKGIDRSRQFTLVVPQLNPNVDQQEKKDGA